MIVIDYMHVLLSLLLLLRSLCVRTEEKIYYTKPEFERERPSFRELEHVGTYNTLVDSCETLQVCHVNEVDAKNYANFCLSKCSQGKHYCVGAENRTEHFCEVLPVPDKRHRYIVVQVTPRTISLYLVPCEDGHIQRYLQNGVEKCVRDPFVHVYRSSTSTSPGLAFCRTEDRYCNALRKLTFELGSDDDRCVHASEKCTVQGLDLLPNCSCASPCPAGMSRNVSLDFECTDNPSSKRQNVADGDTNVSVSEKPETYGSHPNITGGTDLEPILDIDRSNNVSATQPTDVKKMLKEDKEDNLHKDKGTSAENFQGTWTIVIVVVVLLAVIAVCVIGGTAYFCWKDHCKTERYRPINNTIKKTTTYNNNIEATVLVNSDRSADPESSGSSSSLIDLEPKDQRSSQSSDYMELQLEELKDITAELGGSRTCVKTVK